jgi:serine/threonine-protein kinase
MSFAPGSSFSTYQIVSLLGAGGMGEVYRARDSKLGRDVAIKVLPEIAAGDRERRARLAREAQLLASLNHPNVASIFGYEEVDGRSAIVLELVEGVTLSDRLARGSLPIEEAVSIAIQVSRALEAAHEKGIVHRDLKPANIRIRPDGTVKVLDFGIAKMLARVDDQSADAAAVLPTLTGDGTLAGVIIGTAAYMSPEQSRGAAVDARTDVWAFGCVVFEMLTGGAAFAGNTMSDTIAAVLKGEPDWAALPVSTPLAVRRLLRRALAKDPRERLHNIVDARLELQDVGDAQPAVEATRRSLLAPAIGVIGALVLSGAAIWFAVNRRAVEAAPGETTRFAIAIPGDQTLSGFWMVDVSPDGRSIVYAANGQLFLRSLDHLEATPLGARSENVDVPVFSPDGQSIAYSARLAGGAYELRRISINGGQPTTVCVTSGFTRGMRWVGDRLIFGQGETRTSSIFEVPAAGGTPRLLVAARDGEGLSNPDLLDDRDTLVFTRTGGAAAPGDTLMAYSLKTGRLRDVLANARLGRVLPSGHLVYVRANTLAVQPIDPATLELSGGPTVVAENLPEGGSFPYAVNVAIARNGALVYMTAPGQLRQPVWIDRAGGHETPLGAPPKSYVYPTISPDGLRVALNVREGKYSNWVWDIANQTLSRLTTEDEDPRYAIWTSDSRRVIYSASEGIGRRRLMARLVNGSGAAEELSPLVANSYPLTTSPDGRFLIFKEGLPAQFGLKTLSLGPDRVIKSILEFKERSVNTAEVSPDGRWIAHQEGSGSTGNIIVRPFPNVDDGRWLVSQGGSKPVWSRSGRELFFLTSDYSHIAAVPIVAGPAFSFGRASEVVDVRRFQMALQAGSGDVGRTYDVSPDGQRFLVFAPVDSSREQIIVVEHWLNELKPQR